MDIRNFVIVALIACLVWFGTAIVRLENFHYASTLGMCEKYTDDAHIAYRAQGVEHPTVLDLLIKFTERERCMSEVETRTNPIWHLLYGLRVIN